MQVRLFCFFIAGATGLLALSACSEKSGEPGGHAGESLESDPEPLRLDLPDELVALQVRGENPGRAGPEIIRQLHEAYPEGAELTDTLAGFSAEQTILNTSLKGGEAEAATAS